MHRYWISFLIIFCPLHADSAFLPIHRKSQNLMENPTTKCHVPCYSQRYPNVQWWSRIAYSCSSNDYSIEQRSMVSGSVLPFVVLRDGVMCCVAGWCVVWYIVVRWVHSGGFNRGGTGGTCPPVRVTNKIWITSFYCDGVWLYLRQYHFTSTPEHLHINNTLFVYILI